MPWVSKATDDFNRANETPLSGGGNWTPAKAANIGFNLSSNAVTISASGTGNDHSDVYVGRAWASDQYSKANITDPGTNPSVGMGVCVRSTRTSDASTEMYRAVISAGGHIELGKFKPGFSLLHDYSGVSYVAGAVLELRVEGVGTATLLTVIYNGVTIGTHNDNGGSAIDGPNYPGIAYSSDSGGVASAKIIDNWDGGEFEAAVSTAAADNPPIGLIGRGAGW